MGFQLGAVDTSILIIYGLILVGMGIYFFRKTKTSEQFMVAGRGIPAWAAGLAVMSAYTSSISYIAVPGKAFDSNWHPLIFALAAIPVAWFVTKYVVPYYRKKKIISVYGYLEEKIGAWASIGRLAPAGTSRSSSSEVGRCALVCSPPCCPGCRSTTWFI